MHDVICGSADIKTIVFIARSQLKELRQSKVLQRLHVGLSTKMSTTQISELDFEGETNAYDTTIH